MKCYVPIVMMVLLLGCTPEAKVRYVSRLEAVEFLKKEGLVQNEEQVVSAEWKKDIEKWLIVVGYQSTNGTSQAYWFVNSDVTEYSGGTCQH